MKNSRRDFLKSGSAVAALTLSGLGMTPFQSASRKNNSRKAYIPDAGIKLCFAYFRGLQAEARKVEFGKQLNVLGAVAGINPGMAGLKDAKPWDYDTIVAVRAAWEKAGLSFEVVEGPPSLGVKTKLGLDGRDEEIDNFITLMKNLSRAGIKIICYNWMPVISWARTTNDRKGRGGALVTAFD